jgi:hypothetical protein
MYKIVFHFVLRECLISAFSHAQVDVKNGYYFVSKLTFFRFNVCAAYYPKLAVAAAYASVTCCCS